jgi:spore germination protein GerM
MKPLWPKWLRTGLLLLVGMILGAGIVYWVGGPMEETDSSGTGTGGQKGKTSGKIISDKIPVRLYFGDPDENRLEVETAEIQKPESAEESVRWVVERLLEGPRHLVSVIPKDTELKQVFIDGEKTAYLNFSAELATGHPGGAKIELLTLYSITNTVLANNPTLQEVKFLVGGREVDTLAGHVNALRPFRFHPGLVSP